MVGWKPQRPLLLKTELQYKFINIIQGLSVTPISWGIVSRGILDFGFFSEELNHSFCSFEVEDMPLWAPSDHKEFLTSVGKPEEFVSHYHCAVVIRIPMVVKSNEKLSWFRADPEYIVHSASRTFRGHISNGHGMNTLQELTKQGRLCDSFFWFFPCCWEGSTESCWGLASLRVFGRSALSLLGGWHN